VNDLLATVTRDAIDPALKLLPAFMDSPTARVMLLAIGLQESRMTHRFQIVRGDRYAKGPARGLWQFERGGGVFGVLTHRSTEALARSLCNARDVVPTAPVVHPRLEFDDVLAAGFARLLLWSDGKTLPSVHADHEEAWDCYIRNWRPGKPHRATWDDFHAQAVEFVEG
jgi:hypothetical protein